MMALLDRAHVDIINVSQMLKIVRYSTSSDQKTSYEIQVSVGRVQWTVKRRYSEFAELHETLVREHNLDQNLLPPKHAFAKQTEHFLRRRQSDLEVYLLTVWHHLRCFPHQLAEFLKFHQYEVHYMCEKLAHHLFTYNEQVLTQANVQGYPFEMTPIQVYAVAQRIKMPSPTCDSDDPKHDLGHILDVISQLRALRIKGSPATVGTSNMNMNDFHLDMSMFKAIETLYLENCNPASFNQLDNVRASCRTLKVESTPALISFRQFLCSDVDFQWSDVFIDSTINNTSANSNSTAAAGSTALFSNLRWQQLEHAVFSCNALADIDNNIALLSNVRVLDVKRNNITSLPANSLTHLHNLERLDLSYNKLSQLDAQTSTKLGNIKSINVCGNQLTSLDGLSKLYSLEELEAAQNQLETLGAVESVCRLPCLVKLDLRQNPIQQLLDYRTRVLCCFDSGRISEIDLDKAGCPTQNEVDRVEVLCALQQAASHDLRAKHHPQQRLSSAAATKSSSKHRHHRDQHQHRGSGKNLDPFSHSSNNSHLSTTTPPSTTTTSPLPSLAVKTPTSGGGDAAAVVCGGGGDIAGDANLLRLITEALTADFTKRELLNGSTNHLIKRKVITLPTFENEFYGS